MKKLSLLLCLLLGTAVFGDGDALRREALRCGLQAVPKTFDALLRILGENEEELSKEKIALGRALFFEKKLSLDEAISCASCHDLRAGGADGHSAAIGHENRPNPYHLNTPTVLNTALSSKLFWNGRSETLEEQAQGPIIASFEMAASPLLIEERLNADAGYPGAFRAVYKDGKITFDRVIDAISAFERTLITRGRLDAFLEGENGALSSEEQEGLKLFMHKGCVGCHNGMGLGGRALRKFPIMRHGIWSLAKPETIRSLQKSYEAMMESLEESPPFFPDMQSRYDYLLGQLGAQKTALLKEGYFDMYGEQEGYEAMTTQGCRECHEKVTYRVTKETLSANAYPFENKGNFLGRGRETRYFRVPLLRNIVSTKPYFHNGGIAKLEEAIRLMVKHQSRTTISDEELSRLVAFFKAVDGELVDYGVQ